MSDAPSDGNTGPAVIGLFDDRGDPRAEMLAFDQLGPKTRAVINTGLCVNWSAAETLAAIRAAHQDPKNKRVDQQWVKRLSDLNPQISARLRVADEN